MSQRSVWLMAFVLLAGIAVVLGRSCRSESRGASSLESPTLPTAATSVPASSDKAAAAEQAVAERRSQAILSAVDTIHSYLAAVASNDLAKADAFWVGDVPSSSSDESDLRDFGEPHSLRIQNRTPKALDSEAVPAALEIPVELRLPIDGANRHYRGWYRVRSTNPAAGVWKITSADIRPESR